MHHRWAAILLVLLVSGGAGQTLVRLTTWTGSIDTFGRMSGAFHYEFEYTFARVPGFGESANAELSQVVKAP